jgi:hypothetical protein
VLHAAAAALSELVAVVVVVVRYTSQMALVVAMPLISILQHAPVQNEQHKHNITSISYDGSADALGLRGSQCLEHGTSHPPVD